jgi:hypothetical protein
MSESDTIDRNSPEARSARRMKFINRVNAKLPAPTEDELLSLKEHDAESWGEYLCDLADNMGTRRSTALLAFEMLGPSEAFDGLVTTLEDEGDEGDQS